jgi:hypothetical protein
METFNENIIRIKIGNLMDEITFYIKKEFNVNISHQSTSCDVFYEDKLEENLIIIDEEDHVSYYKTVFELCRFNKYYNNDSLFKIFINNKDISLPDSIKIVDFLKNKYNQLKFEIKIFRNNEKWFALKSFIEMNEYNEKNDYIFCIDVSFTNDFLLYCKKEDNHNNYKYITITGNCYDNIIAYHDEFIAPSCGGGNLSCYPKPHTIEHLYHECKHNHNHKFYILINPREIKIQENIIDYIYDYAFKITGDGDFKLFKNSCIEILESFKEFFKNNEKNITIQCDLKFPERKDIFLKDINNELKRIKINMLGIKKGE